MTTASLTSLDTDGGGLQVAAQGAAAGFLATTKESVTEQRATRPIALAFVNIFRKHGSRGTRSTGPKSKGDELENIERWSNAVRNLREQ